MGREREEIGFRTTPKGVRIVYGRFYINDKLVRKDICTFDEMVFRDPVNKKGKRTKTAQSNYVYQKRQELEKSLKQKAIEEQSKGELLSTLMQEYLDWGDVIRNWDIQTVRAYSEALNYYLSAVGDHNIGTFRDNFYADYSRHLVSLEQNSNTIRKNISTVARFYKWAHKRKKIDFLPDFEKPQESKRDPKPYTKQHLHDMAKLIISKKHSALTTRDRKGYIIHFRALIGLTETGMRGGEIRVLPLKNIRLEEGVIHIRSVPEAGWTVKKDKERTVRISSTFMTFLVEDLKSRDSQENYYLDDGNGGLRYKSGLDPLTKAFQKYRDTLGIDPAIKPLHGIRAFVATELALNGTSLIEIKNLLGHEDIATTMIYVEYAQSLNSQSVEKIDIQLPPMISAITATLEQLAYRKRLLTNQTIYEWQNKPSGIVKHINRTVLRHKAEFLEIREHFQGNYQLKDSDIPILESLGLKVLSEIAVEKAGLKLKSYQTPYFRGLGVEYYIWPTQFKAPREQLREIELKNSC